MPVSPNPDFIADQKIVIFHTRFQTRSLKSIPIFGPGRPNLACSRFSDSWGDSPVFSRFIFVFSLFQFSGPNYLRALNRLGLIRQKFCHHCQVRAETKKIPQMHFEFAHFYFVLIHLELKRLIRPFRSSLENHTRLHTKMGKVFSDQKGPNPHPSIIKGSTTPDPDPFHDC